MRHGVNNKIKRRDIKRVCSRFDESQRVRNESGFSLIEVLVSVFVLSIGLLGVAVMHVKSVAIAHESHMRSQAVVVVHDLLERIKLNSQVSYASKSLAGGGTGSEDCVGKRCSNLELKNFDLSNWQSRLARTFPKALARVEEHSVEGRESVTISLTWLDVGDGSAADLDADAKVSRSFVVTAYK